MLTIGRDYHRLRQSSLAQLTRLRVDFPNPKHSMARSWIEELDCNERDRRNSQLKPIGISVASRFPSHFEEGAFGGSVPRRFETLKNSRPQNAWQAQKVFPDV